MYFNFKQEDQKYLDRMENHRMNVPRGRDGISMHLVMHNNRNPRIENIIQSGPATVVLWDDGTKTVTKCMKTDTYDKEKGLAMAIAKKYLGSNQYRKTFKLYSNNDSNN